MQPRQNPIKSMDESEARYPYRVDNSDLDALLLAASRPGYNPKRGMSKADWWFAGLCALTLIGMAVAAIVYN